MRFFSEHCYTVYILTNFNKTVLYIGITGDLLLRQLQHEQDSKSGKKHFAGKYNCIYIVYYEDFQWVQDAIKREKQLKRWSRKKKEALINGFNSGWEFLNKKIGF